MGILSLLWGTVIHRPYVYAFFVCYLFFAIPHLRARGTAAWTVLAYVIAFGCEYSSTRNGFPFGYYRYFDGMRSSELWISNVPFWDSLSFVFLSYFSWRVAGAVLTRISHDRLFDPATAILAGVLMMLLDVVIDPIALRGDRWFLGQVYDYPEGGTYFGVTLANFAGWFFVGAVIVFVFQQLALAMDILKPRKLEPLSDWGALAVYAGVFIFNLAITGWIAERRLFLSSLTVTVCTLGICIRLFSCAPRRMHPQ